MIRPGLNRIKMTKIETFERTDTIIEITDLGEVVVSEEVEEDAEAVLIMENVEEDTNLVLANSKEHSLNRINHLWSLNEFIYSFSIAGEMKQRPTRMTRGVAKIIRKSLGPMKRSRISTYRGGERSNSTPVTNFFISYRL